MKLISAVLLSSFSIFTQSKPFEQKVEPQVTSELTESKELNLRKLYHYDYDFPHPYNDELYMFKTTLWNEYDLDLCLNWNDNNELNLMECVKTSSKQAWLLDTNGYLRNSKEKKKCIGPDSYKLGAGSKLVVMDCPLYPVRMLMWKYSKYGLLRNKKNTQLVLDVTNNRPGDAVVLQNKQDHRDERNSYPGQSWKIKYTHWKKHTTGRTGRSVSMSTEAPRSNTYSSRSSSSSNSSSNSSSIYQSGYDPDNYHYNNNNNKNQSGPKKSYQYNNNQYSQSGPKKYSQHNKNQYNNNVRSQNNHYNSNHYQSGYSNAHNY